MTDRTRPGRLAGRTALITGASRGIGRDIARIFAAEGAHLFLTATNLAKLEETRSLCADGGVELHCHGADLSDPEAVETLFNAAASWRDGLDIVVNNAGIYIGKPFVDYDLADLDQVMKVNVYAVFQLTQLAVQHMLGRRREDHQHGLDRRQVGEPQPGRLQHLEACRGRNDAVRRPSRRRPRASTSTPSAPASSRRACSTACTRPRRPSACRLGSSSNRSCPASPMGRLVTGEEVAHLAVYLASSESDGMTGQSIPISGGMRMG